MPRSRYGLQIFAAIVAISALGLVVFGVLALGRAVRNAQAAASQEARNAAIAGVREMHARIANPNFAATLPADERMQVTQSDVEMPLAIPRQRVAIDADFITESALELARQLEFVEKKPAAARSKLDAALARTDRSSSDRARMLAAAMWLLYRNGDPEAARSYRARIAHCRDITSDVAARVALFDISCDGTIDADIANQLLERPAPQARDLVSRMRALKPGDETQSWISTHVAQIDRIDALRRGVIRVRVESNRLRSLDRPTIQGRRGTDGSDAVLLWLPAASPTEDYVGSAWLMPLERFMETLSMSSGAQGGSGHQLAFTLSTSTTDEASIPAFDGMHAIPRAQDIARDSITTLVVLIALATTFALALWLLLRAFRRERAALADRSDFLRSITHELRTPLASIRLFAETLASGRARDEKKRAEYTELLAVEAGRLSTLVENALDLGRTERGERSWSFEPTRIDELTRESVALFEPLAREASMSVHCDLEEATVSADRDAMRQVLWNLLDNARKYGSSGGKIDVQIVADKTRTTIRVRDHGPGIDAVERERAFDRFVRGRAQQDGSTPGAGLGLSIARSIIHAHDGTLDYEKPASGNGACFAISLPVTSTKSEDR